MLKKYIIVVASGDNSTPEITAAKKLPDKVNAMIKQGYIPVGGVAVITPHPGGPDIGPVYIYQAMVLKD